MSMRSRKQGGRMAPSQNSMEETELCESQNERRPGADGTDNVMSEAEFWDEELDSDLGGLGPRRQRNTAKAINARKARAKLADSCFLWCQCGACLLVVIACLAAWLVPYFTVMMDPNVKELIKQGDVHKLREHIDKDPKFSPNAVGDADMTALHWAAIKEKIDVASLLVERRADIEQQSDAGMTPLHYAAREGHVEFAAFLLKQNATVNEVDVNGWTPLHWTAVYGHKDVADFLIETGKADPLIEGISRHHRTAQELAWDNKHKALAKALKVAEEASKQRKQEELAKANKTTKRTRLNPFR